MRFTTDSMPIRRISSCSSRNVSKSFHGSEIRAVVMPQSITFCTISFDTDSGTFPSPLRYPACSLSGVVFARAVPRRSHSNGSSSRSRIIFLICTTGTKNSIAS